MVEKLHEFSFSVGKPDKKSRCEDELNDNEGQDLY